MKSEHMVPSAGGLSRVASSSVQKMLDALSASFDERLSTNETVRAQHGSGESWLPAGRPDAVVTARSTQEVAEVLRVCNQHSVPVIPFGAGSSIEGQIHAHLGGISLDLADMNEIVSVNADDMDCVVQCGVVRQQLNEDLREQGLFFPVDLGAHATLSGMVATRASGTTTVRYGSMRDLVLGLMVVLPDGEVIKVEFRGPMRTSPRLQAVIDRLRSEVSALREDRSLAPDIARAAQLVTSGVLLEVVEIQRLVSLDEML